MIKISMACGVAVLALIGSVALAADQFATPDEAKALLERAVAAMKTDKDAALKQFNNENDKQFRDRDLYIFCFNVGDGKLTAYESPMLLGVDIRELKLPPNDAVGQRTYDAVHNAPEGTFVTVDYEFPKPGTKKPATKQSLQTRIGNQACGVTYFK